MLDYSCKCINIRNNKQNKERDNMEKRELKKILEKNLDVINNLWRSL